MTKQKNRLIKHHMLKPSYLLGYSTCGLLMLLMLAFLLPFCADASSAKDNSTATAATRAVVNAAASISLALDAEVNIDITPTGSDGTFSNSSTTVTVATNNPEGYTLYLNTTDTTNAMTSTNPSQNSATISALSSPTTATGFLPNTWGYSLSQDAIADLTYSAVPLTSTAIQKTSSSATEDTYALTFGAKIDTSLPAGQYSNSVMLSAIANPIVISNLQNLVYMQDMTSSICQDTKAANGANTVTPGNEVEKRLIDTRDGKEYWVAKLADQNCWMTQNLALDLNEQTLPLTSASSDVSEEWRPASYTEVGIPTTDTTNDLTTTRSWTVGDYVLATPDNTATCNISPSQDFEQACIYLKNVGTIGWKPTFVAQFGTWQGTNTGPLDANGNPTEGFIAAQPNTDGTGGEYDAHYLLGNYYPINTATAGTTGTKVSPASSNTNPADLIDAPDSICPKGWQLPVSGRDTTTGMPYNREKSIYKLILAYGYTTSDIVIGKGNDGNPSPMFWLKGDIIATGISGPAYQNLVRPPFYFTRSGSLSTNYLQNIVDGGNYWSSTISNTSSRSYSNTFYSHYSTYGYISPSNDLTRYAATSIRCLAK